MALKDFMARGERGIGTVPGKTEGAMTGATGTMGTAAGAEMSRPLAEARAPRTVSPSTSVDASSELEGTLRCKETLRVDGRITGEVYCEKTVLVGEGARIFASITADEVQIAGVVEGDITARRKITLARTAAVVGDLTTPGIVIEEGAKLKGRIVIGSDAEPAYEAAQPARDAKRAQAPRKPQAAAPKTGDAPSSQPVAASA